MNKFVADGSIRFLIGQEVRLREVVRLRHADELAVAGPFKRLRIRWQMWREVRSEAKQSHQPSAGTLY
jgi:hypothetical protein